jgi:hypothetical protein
MGAAATVELTKPIDASDILQSDDLNFAKHEVIRLRGELGHLAKAYGVPILSFDASDIVLGEDRDEDFQRCVREIAHIRQCLRLNTQQSVRQQRTRNYQRQHSSGHIVPVREIGMIQETKSDSKYDDEKDDDSSSSESDN